MIRTLFATMIAMAMLGFNALPALAQAMPIGTTESDYGTILVDAKGMTLYVFQDGLNCTAGCLTTWPAVTVESANDATGAANVTGTFAASERGDGTMQATYNGMPLYYYAADNAAGDMNGQGVGERWYVVSLGAATFAEARTMSMAAAAPEATEVADEQEESPAAETTAAEAPMTLPATGAPIESLPLALILLGMIVLGAGLGYLGARA